MTSVRCSFVTSNQHQTMSDCTPGSRVNFNILHVKKYRIFFTCVDITNQLLTRHSPLAPPGQVDE